MSVFHDLVAADIDDIFLDPDYFGEEHVVDGVVCQCVIDDDIYDEDANARALGITRTGFTLYINERDVERRLEGDLLTIDGRTYTVSDWRSDMGVARVTLTRPSAY